MEAITLAMMGATALSGLFSAGSGLASSARQSKLALANATRQAELAYGEAQQTGLANLNEADATAQAYLRQNDRTVATFQQNRKIMDLQEGMAIWNADIAARQGLVQENRTRDATERGIASMVASFSGRGISPTSGSPLAAMAESAAQGEMDAQIVSASAQMARAEQLFQAQGIAMQRANMAENVGMAIDDSGFAIDNAFSAAKARTAGAYRNAGIAATSAGIVGQQTAGTAKQTALYGAAGTLLNTASSMFKTYATAVPGAK